MPLIAGIDGLGVRTKPRESFQPDGVVLPLADVTDDDRFAPNPVIVFEVLSPSTRKLDLGKKVYSYGLVPSIEHDLMIDPIPETVVLFRRGPAGLVRPSAPVAASTLRLDPPGIELDLARFFAQ